ncbi:MAG: winged helix-turn-helix transcriptional regulator [Candidatus Diapherotrites archaeon]|nr:winged helix-turn-helix transcriptional regulator [Candidatus Diapherotrites archaeon]
MRSFEQVLYWLIAGSKGGINRARIIDSLESEPMNSNALSKKLELDYKTVQHHLELLLENQIIVKSGSKYGQMFFLSPEMNDNMVLFKKLFDKKKLLEEKNE